jgi:hypothetical protein
MPKLLIRSCRRIWSWLFWKANWAKKKPPVHFKYLFKRVNGFGTLDFKDKSYEIAKIAIFGIKKC